MHLAAQRPRRVMASMRAMRSVSETVAASASRALAACRWISGSISACSAAAASASGPPSPTRGGRGARRGRCAGGAGRRTLAPPAGTTRSPAAAGRASRRGGRPRRGHARTPLVANPPPGRRVVCAPPPRPTAPRRRRRRSPAPQPCSAEGVGVCGLGAPGLAQDGEQRVVAAARRFSNSPFTMCECAIWQASHANACSAWSGAAATESTPARSRTRHAPSPGRRAPSRAAFRSRPSAVLAQPQRRRRELGGVVGPRVVRLVAAPRGGPRVRRGGHRLARWACVVGFVWRGIRVAVDGRC